MKNTILALAFATYGLMIAEAAVQRPFGAAFNALSLDGIQAGFLGSVEGGAVSADVIVAEEPGGQAGEKHLGRLRYENFNVQFGLAGMDRSVYEWISRSWGREPIRKNGAIIVSNYDLHPLSRAEFFNAAITETTFPACDAAGKESGFIRAGFAPEYTRSAKVAGRAIEYPPVSAQRRWLQGDFRLTIDGLDCSRILRIESFTVKRAAPSGAVGDTRDYLAEPGKVEFPNLKITLSAVYAETWQQWFQDFVVAGKNATGDEKRGKLEFLSNNRQEVLASVAFEGLGIFRLEQVQGTHEGPGRVVADLYCEKMAFIPGATGR